MAELHVRRGMEMTLLIIGVLLWSFVHLLTTVGRPIRQRVISQVGEKPWLGLFSLAIAASVVIMVMGWRSTPEQYLYVLGGWARHLTMLLMLVAFVLFSISHTPSRIKRFVRHPQLTAMICWSVAHLLSNGTGRALVLFGGLGLWALLEILLINARDGHYEPPAPRPLPRELIGIVLAVVLMAIVMLLHRYISGIPLIV